MTVLQFSIVVVIAVALLRSIHWLIGYLDQKQLDKFRRQTVRDGGPIPTRDQARKLAANPLRKEE